MKIKNVVTKEKIIVTTTIVQTQIVDTVKSLVTTMTMIKNIEKIYITLAKNFHPDKNNNSDESVRAMQIINELKNIWQI